MSMIQLIELEVKESAARATSCLFCIFRQLPQARIVDVNKKETNGSYTAW